MTPSHPPLKRPWPAIWKSWRRSPPIPRSRRSKTPWSRWSAQGATSPESPSLFWNRAGADTNDTIQALEREMAPKLSRHFSLIAMDSRLFARIDSLWQARDTLDLDKEQDRVLERSWKGFVKAGARLGKPEQQRLADIGERLAALGARFGQNVLADEKRWFLLLENETDLAGLPGFLLDAMAAAATDRGHRGAFAVTLSRSIIEPFLTFSERRDLRKQAYRAWLARGETEAKRTIGRSSPKSSPCARRRRPCSATRTTPR
jgi:peptidyl-dipeptidase Dcp